MPWCFNGTCLRLQKSERRSLVHLKPSQNSDKHADALCWFMNAVLIWSHESWADCQLAT